MRPWPHPRAVALPVPLHLLPGSLSPGHSLAPWALRQWEQASPRLGLDPQLCVFRCLLAPCLRERMAAAPSSPLAAPPEPLWEGLPPAVVASVVPVGDQLLLATQELACLSLICRGLAAWGPWA